MKLVIQIPCLNEAEQLPATLAALPRVLPGIDSIERVVIDDGSTDGTAEVARSCGADHVVRLRKHSGLATAFSRGLAFALSRDADIVVNTDADNQYAANCIAALIAPIRDGSADIVIGERPISDMAHFPPGKKWLQRVGSLVVRGLSGVAVADATSGFRAFSRDAARRINVFSNYTYTLETLIQAGQSRLAVVSVPITVNAPTRPSRLISSTSGYVVKAALSLLRAFVVYRPLRSLAVPALAAVGAGTLLGLRFVYLFVRDGGTAGHVQSLILASILIIGGVLVGIAGIIADLIAVNRRLLEDIQYHARDRDGTRR